MNKKDKEFVAWLEFCGPEITGDVYPGSSKAFYKNGCARFFRRAAKTLNLEKDKYEIRFCAGGPAVAGEAIFHTDQGYFAGYVELGRVLYRKVNGLKDYTGGPNNYFPIRQFSEEKIVEIYRSMTNSID